MGLEPLQTYAKYSAAWNAKSANEVAGLLVECWSDDGVFFDPETPEGLRGRNALTEYIVATQAEMPGLEVSDLSEPESLGDRLRTKWVARQDGQVMFTGTDFVEFASDGRVSRITMFYDSSPT